MTKQELFDKIVAYAQTMTARASVAGKCRYRTHDGNRCWIGSLIPDDKYDKTMDGICGSTSFHGVLEACGIPGELMTFAGTLQAIHDRCAIQEWPTRLSIVADREGLVFDRGAYKQAA